jgi:hypothetical protein
MNWKSCHWAAPAVMGLLALAGMANSASAQCANYGYTTSSGNTIVPGTTNTGNACDDCATAVTLPFAWSFYGTSYNTIYVDSNGYVTFNSGDPQYLYNEGGYTTMPYTGFTGAAMAVAWTDGYSDGAAHSIYTGVSGVTPNRIFNIEWRSGYYPGAAGTMDCELRLYEGSSQYDFVYGTMSNNWGALVGVQNPGHTQFVQVQGYGSAPAAGTTYSFTCLASTPLTSTLSVSPTSGAAGTSFSAFCTVTPATGPASTGIAASLDASAIGGGNVALHDDGVFPDVTAGDNIFSGTVTSSGSTVPAAYTLTANVSDAQSRTSSSSTTYTVIPPPPPNDECSGALPAVLGNNNFDSTAATTSSPAAACGLLGSDLWYTFTPATAGTLTVSACGGTGSDTAIAIYTDCVTSLACNDDSCGLQSTVSACVNANQQYYLRVGGFNGTHWTGFFNVAVSAGGGAPTISATAACGLPGYPATINGTLTTLPCGATLNSVTADASSVGGSNAVVLHNDGATPDQTAGDTIWSGDATIAAATAAGSYNIPVTFHLSSGDFSTTASMTVGAPYAVPAGAVAEGEPCDYNTNDTVNGGCNFTPNNYTQAALCTTYSGQVWSTYTNRDTDWWHFSLPVAGNVTVVGQSQAPSYIFIYNYPCPATNEYAFAASCGSFTTTASLAAGDYTFILVPQTFNGEATCGVNDGYWFTLTSDTYNCGGPNPPSVAGNTALGTIGGTALLTATVTPGTNPTSTGLAVTGDLTSLGGSATQQFYDDGTHGDVTAGDNVFSLAVAIPNSAVDGTTYTVPLTVTDAQARSGSGSATAVADVGSLPATALTINSAGPINGMISAAGDADMYRIHICDPANFTAVVDPANSTIGDSQLFLFHLDGTGVAMDDDDPNGTNGLLSRLQGPLVQSIPAGDYYLAISAYDCDPVDSNGLDDIWAETPFNVIRAPDGTNPGAAVSAWDTGGIHTGTYSIILTGVQASCGLPPCCRNDYNGDGAVGTDADIDAFFACLSGNCCPTCPPNADFNCDGAVGTDADIESFFRVLSGGQC